jgi:hypothetical protein
MRDATQLLADVHRQEAAAQLLAAHAIAEGVGAISYRTDMPSSI